MKLSDSLSILWDLATAAPQYSKTAATPDGKEALKLIKQLYKEVLVLEKEGRDFNGENS